MTHTGLFFRRVIYDRFFCIYSLTNVKNRKLQEALNAWFEYGCAVVLPQARFVQDITIGEGESVPPNNKFTKTWRLGTVQHIFIIF